MTTDTHTMAGLVASAGDARVGGVTHAAAGGAYAGGTVDPAFSHRHLSTTWTQGRIACTTPFMVVNGKNGPTRPLSERSP